jgi:hypothetical protein
VNTSNQQGVFDMYLNLLATISCPVTARGNSIYNAKGDKVAECTDGWIAAAMVALINYGIPGAEAEHQSRLDHEAAIAAIIPSTVKLSRAMKGKA